MNLTGLILSTRHRAERITRSGRNRPICEDPMGQFCMQYMATRSDIGLNSLSFTPKVVESGMRTNTPFLERSAKNIDFISVSISERLAS